MTIWINALLFCEGNTDHRFFETLIPRVVHRLTLESPHIVEIHILPSLPSSLRGRYPDFRKAIEGYIASINLLLIHSDGNGDPEAVRKTVIAPYLEAIADLHGFERTQIIPIREMEAWALADPDAIPRVTRSTVSASTLLLPERAGEVEAITDPKMRLDEAISQCHNPRRGTRLRGRDFFDNLGSQVSLDRLIAVPSFRVLYSDLREALIRLGALSEQAD
jgi:hypothetical protein